MWLVYLLVMLGIYLFNFSSFNFSLLYYFLGFFLPFLFSFIVIYVYAYEYYICHDIFSILGRRLAIVAGSSVLGGVSERISQTRKTRR
jgi:hypothetical protein